MNISMHEKITRKKLKQISANGTNEFILLYWVDILDDNLIF